MTARILVLHAYSAENAGDGLLVLQTLEVLREALGDVDVTVIALRPETFQLQGVTTLPAISWPGTDSQTRAALASTTDYSLIVGVGGGYLRGGRIVEAAKSMIVHLRQLIAASRSSTPSIYLPQSIGPARLGTAIPLNKLLRGIDRVMLRDDRSMQEFGGAESRRVPDLATLPASRGRRTGTAVDATPIVSIRAVHGRVPPGVFSLAQALGTYDSYVQSTTGGNDDRPATALMRPRVEVSREELLDTQRPPRVVVAVRLHAALMALAAGHYVVHLAYERKGFGAFEDLKISPWVHSVNRFDVKAVQEQVASLIADPGVRHQYDGLIAASRDRLEAARAEIVREIQAAVSARATR